LVALPLDNVKALADFVLKQFGRIDMWINNAGIQVAPSHIEDVDVQKLYRLFDINFSIGATWRLFTILKLRFADILRT
jgi:NAD(P)-dependent dehydrogenase (short-subunit alcohol dehydrogenase family)